MQWRFHFTAALNKQSNNHEMKNLKNILLAFGLLLILYGCKKDKQTDFKDFYNGHEIVYTGQVTRVTTQPGNLEMGLKWKTGVDPTITGYIIYYNNGADSQIVKLTAKTDSVKAIVKGLSEYTYTFTIYSFDAQGNRSVPTIINNAKVYGPLYAAGLVNRPFDAANPYNKTDEGYLKLNFATADTINTKTLINYTSKAGIAKTAVLRGNSSSIIIEDYKAGTPITYKSFYIPEKTAIDEFEVAAESTFPEIVTHYAQCDKSLFSEIVLPNDIIGSPGQGIAHLWDGSVGPQAPPNLFFSDSKGGSTIFPQYFTFDMGKVYNNLGKVEETGSVIPPLNATEFEVWGIADITGAETTLPGNDAGWEAEAIAKGWVLLKTCSRSDDGGAPMAFDITNPPPVRYIRIRVKKVLAVTTVTMSELTFWNIE
jgi:hypothetical protein